MSIFNIKQSFILYQTFGNIYTIAPFCKHVLCVFHTIAWLILLAHAQTNFPPVHWLIVDNCEYIWCPPMYSYQNYQSSMPCDKQCAGSNIFALTKRCE